MEVDPDHAPLTLQQASMLNLRAQGMTYEEIGADWGGLTRSRVGQVLGKARDALGTATIDEAVEEARRRGLIDPPPASS